MPGPAITATRRFGARASARMPAVLRSSTVTAWCDARDTLTAAAAPESGE